MLSLALFTSERLVVWQGRALPDAEFTLATRPLAQVTWMHDCIAVQATQVAAFRLPSDNRGNLLRVNSAKC